MHSMYRTIVVSLLQLLQYYPLLLSVTLENEITQHM